MFWSDMPELYHEIQARGRGDRRCKVSSKETFEGKPGGRVPYAPCFTTDTPAFSISGPASLTACPRSSPRPSILGHVGQDYGSDQESPNPYNQRLPGHQPR